MSTIAKLVAKAELDHSGFDKGITAMGNSVDKMEKTTGASTSKMAASFSKISAAATSLFRIISIGSAMLLLSPIIAAFVAIVAVIGLMKASITEAFKQPLLQTNQAVQDIKNSALEVRSAFANMSIPLIIAVLPAIQTILNWLIRLFNLISMIIAAWNGQKQVMQIIAGSVKTAAGGAGSLAKNTEKAKKAAEGFLAAFDQLNVLQQAKPPEATDIGSGLGTGAGSVGMEMVNVTDKVLKNITAIKAGWAELVKKWNDAMKGWGEVGKFFGTFSSNLYNFVQGIVNGIWTLVQGVVNGIWIFVQGVINFVGDTLEAFWKLFHNLTKEGWAEFKVDIKNAWDTFANVAKQAWNTVIASFSNALSTIKSSFLPFLETLRVSLSVFVTWISTNVTNPIYNAFGTAFDFIGQKFSSVLEGIKGTAIVVVNAIIGFLNTMITGMTDKINGLITLMNKIPSVNIPTISSSTIPYITRKDRSINGYIPGLAEGAVIPPNNRFAAMLGDQKSGTNIEAPADLIRQIVREELGGGELTVNMPVYLDSEKIYDGQKKVQTRRGGSLVRSGLSI